MEYLKSQQLFSSPFQEYYCSTESFQKTKKVLIHSIILMIFSTILLLIAAPIETFVSVPFSEFMGNLLK